MPQALVNCEPLPPEYHQDNELLLPPKCEQELIEEEQQCENELLGNGQHGTYGVQHGVQYSDQENAYCEQEELPPRTLRWRKRVTQGSLKYLETSYQNWACFDRFSKIESVVS